MPDTSSTDTNSTNSTEPNSPIDYSQFPDPSNQRRLPLMEKLKQVMSAWEGLASGETFAKMTLAQFIQAVSASTMIRARLRDNRVEMIHLIRQRTQCEKELNETLKRAANAVRCDKRFGDNSPLYRSMGFIPSCDRKPRSAPSAEGLPQAKPTFPNIQTRYERMVAAWEKEGHPILGGMSPAELTEAGNSWLEIKYKLEGERALQRSFVGLKREVDAASRSLLKKVVASVVASHEHGENSALYRAMGYIPLDERKPRRPKARNGIETA